MMSEANSWKGNYEATEKFELLKLQLRNPNELNMFTWLRSRTEHDAHLRLAQT